MRPSRGVAAGLCAFVALVWVNQGIGGVGWERFRDRVEAGEASVLERAWYPLSFLYRRSLDEALYRATAGAVLGLPYDAAVLDRGKSSDSFAVALPPADGHFHAPYTEVPFEYPPPALAVILPLRLAAPNERAFGYGFGAIMGALLLVSLALADRLAAASGHERTPERASRDRALLATLLLLAHGGLAVQRLDALVAVLLASAAWAAHARRPAWLGVFLGLATATKLVPALLVPVVIAADPRVFRHVRVTAAAGLGALSTLVLGLSPMLAGGGLAQVLRYHGERGLHVESTLGIAYGAFMALTGHHQEATRSFGSMNFHGPLAQGLAGLATPSMLAVVAFVTWRTWRASQASGDTRRTERLVYALLAACTGIWLTAKVFSPQYMTWAVPLVVALAGPRRRAAQALFFAALLVSQIYLRGYYDYVYQQHPLGILTMLVRQGALVALFVTCVRALDATAEALRAAAQERAGRAAP